MFAAGHTHHVFNNQSLQSSSGSSNSSVVSDEFQATTARSQSFTSMRAGHGDIHPAISDGAEIQVAVRIDRESRRHMYHDGSRAWAPIIFGKKLSRIRKRE